MTISAKVIADSVSPQGVRITTFELEYPRFIHAEFMTHRLFSRNAASSRAIPVDKAIELIINDTARPIHWGKNQPGMSAKEENDKLIQLTTGTEFAINRKGAWDYARDMAIAVARAFSKAGYHKQIVNRLLEPFTHIKVVVTATEYDNFFWLRCHPDAQPEIQALADEMFEALSKSSPVELKPGEWHVPYYGEGYWSPSDLVDISQFEITDLDKHGVSLQDALAISSSCCAQVSYRRLDDSLEKARDIFKRLVESKPVHASPFEHQATPNDPDQLLHEKGMTHLMKAEVDGQLFWSVWSGNLRGWVQHRQLIDDNACWIYKP